MPCASCRHSSPPTTRTSRPPASWRRSPSASATPRRRALAFERIVVIDPFDSAAHTALGRIAVERRDAALATREFRAALASGPVNPAPAHCDLSEALLLGGQKAEAKKEVLAALEIAPTYGRAQDLLLKIVDGK